MGVMPGGLLLLTSCVASFAFAADPPPEFSAAGVVRGTESAPILVPGEPAGFQFAVRAIAGKGAPCAYTLQALKSQFPDLKGS
jgi:hypothetical protein